MKRKETKSNNSKHPVKKLIALWVVFALLIVPFANHVGDKNGAKAEGGSTTGVKTGNLQIVSEEPNGLSIEVDDTGVVVPHTGETYEKSVTLIKDAQKVGKLQLPECKTDGGDAVALGAGFMTLDKQIQSTLSAGENLFPLTENVENDLAANAITEDRKIAIYARIDSAADWQLQYVLTVNFVDSAFTTGAGLYAGSISLTSDSYVSEATLKAPTTVASIEGATVKYYVKIGSAADESEKKDINSYTFIGDTISTTENNRGKQVYAYAALVSNETPAQVLEYIELGSTHMSNDTQAPNISCEASAVSYLDEETSAYATIQNRFIDENSVYYGVGDKYKYAVTVEDPTKDGEDTSGIKNVTATLNGTSLTVTSPASGSNVYTIELTKEQATGDVVTVTAVDNKGNSKDYKCPIKIQQATEGTKVTGVTFVDDDSWDGLTEG